MKMLHIEIVFQDEFSGAYTKKTTTVSDQTFKKMQADIGKTVNHFSNNILWNWKVISIEQCKPIQD